jgi:hypothetical protein
MVVTVGSALMIMRVAAGFGAALAGGVLLLQPRGCGAIDHPELAPPGYRGRLMCQY